MDVDKSYGLAGLTLLAGLVLGGAIVGLQTQKQLDSLNQKVEELENERNTDINYSQDRTLSELFNDVEDSVVSIRAAGNERAQGSGFVYNSKGHIVTNEHVVSEAEQIEVTFTDGSTKNARVVGKDPYTDLAVLKTDKKDLDSLKLGESSEVKVGQRAIAIGNPFGLRSSMTTGIISQRGRTIQIQGGFSIPNVLQTDAAINPGNSGGPLMNINGEVVGVNTAIESRTGTFSGIGFAVPASTVERVVPELIEGETYEHPWIGISGLDVNEDIAEAMNLNESSGFLIVNVVEDGPAEEAGLEAGSVEADINGRPVNIGGDVITHINGERMRGIDDILLYLARETEAGETITLTVIRNGDTEEIDLTLDSRPDPDELDQ